jgi:Cro/C1-type HTH DNA-binding domain
MRQVVRNRVAELVAIKGRRENRLIPVKVLTEETGLARGTVETWLANDVNRFDGDVMLTWCAYLGCEIADLFVVEAVESPEKKAYYMEAARIPA